jgi:protein subunit release factor A
MTKSGGRSVVVEVRPGAGGEQAAWAAGEIHRMLISYAERLEFAVSRLSEDADAYVFAIGDPDAWSVFRFEAGTHRVQRVRETELQGRIHTSTVTVAVELLEAIQTDRMRPSPTTSTEKIRTYNYPKGWVKDHRVNLLLTNLPDVLRGHVERFTAALRDDEHRGQRE